MNFFFCKLLFISVFYLRFIEELNEFLSSYDHTHFSLISNQFFDILI